MLATPNRRLIEAPTIPDRQYGTGDIVSWMPATGVRLIGKILGSVYSPVSSQYLYTVSSYGFGGVSEHLVHESELTEV